MHITFLGLTKQNSNNYTQCSNIGLFEDYKLKVLIVILPLDDFCSTLKTASTPSWSEKLKVFPGTVPIETEHSPTSAFMPVKKIKFLLSKVVT